MIRTLANIASLGGAVLGSVLIALNLGFAAWGYVAFLVSSIASVWLLFKSKDAPQALIYQNFFFTGVNVLGLIRHGLS